MGAPTQDFNSCEAFRETADTEEGFACSDSARAPAAASQVRWKGAATDLEFPPVPFPSNRVFAMAEEPRLRALVKRHHERMRDTSVGQLFPQDPVRFAAGIERAADFLVESVGGPARYTMRNGPSCMRTTHFAFTIDEQARDIWLAQMLLSLEDVGFPNEIRMEFWNWVEAMSMRMINRRTMRAQPNRYSWSEAAVKLFPFMTTRLPRLACQR